MNYDFVLVLATVGVLFLISLLCVGGMFYFKWADLQSLGPMAEVAYQGRMNRLLAPLLVALLLVLGICVPKRLIPSRWLHAFVILLVLAALGVTLIWGWQNALLLVLLVSAALQAVVLFLIALGRRLNFHCEGYWNRLGSSVTHLGLVLFCLDFLLLGYPSFHLGLFWSSVVCLFAGIVLSFYAEGLAGRLWGR
jgi:hypothetical protein